MSIQRWTARHLELKAIKPNEKREQMKNENADVAIMFQLPETWSVVKRSQSKSLQCAGCAKLWQTTTNSCTVTAERKRLQRVSQITAVATKIT